MLAMLDGHDRTEAEYLTLLDKAGFSTVDVQHSAAESMLEAVPR